MSWQPLHGQGWDRLLASWDLPLPLIEGTRWEDRGLDGKTVGNWGCRRGLPYGRVLQSAFPA